MCRSGKRSAAAIMQLEQKGFTNLSNLRGGILAWQAEIDPELNVY
jgi:rhodanese-related sulfurtransferase